MKQLVSLVLISIISINLYIGIGFSQNSKVVSAYNHLQYGELDKAKDAIDAASVHEKTINKPKTWWFRGQIYQSIHKNAHLAPDAVNIAYESYVKALVLNFKDPQYLNLNIENNEQDKTKFFTLLSDKNTKYINKEILNDVKKNRFPALAVILVNKGVNEYQETKNYEKSLMLFENSLFLFTILGKVDTLIYYYTANAAEKAKNYDKARYYYQILIDANYGEDNKEKASMYYYLANLQGDTAKYLDILKKGIEKYPEQSQILIDNLINYYLSVEKTKPALEYIKLAIKKNPENPTYYFTQGNLFDIYLEQKDSAVVYYKKAIGLKPGYFDALYNLGALYFNIGVEHNEIANEIKDLTKFKAEKAKADEKFKLALPYLEKAHRIMPQDHNTKISLKQIYYRLKMMDKYEEVKAKL